MKKIFAIACLIVLIAGPVWATDYYLSKGGSSTSPYDTWAKGATTVGLINALNPTASASHNIYIRPGDTFTDATLTLASWVNSGLTVNIEGKDGDSKTVAGDGRPWLNGNVIRPMSISKANIVTLTIKDIDIGGSDAGNQLRVELNRMTNLVLDGLYFDGSKGGGTFNNGLIKNVNIVQFAIITGDIEVKNCVFTNGLVGDFATSLTKWIGSTDLIYLHFYFPESWVANKFAGTILIHDNVMHDVYSDIIQLSGVRCTTKIYDNLFYNFGENAVDNKASANVEFYQNEVYTSASYDGHPGTGIAGSTMFSYAQPGDQIDGPPSESYLQNYKIHHNYFHDSGGAGIVVPGKDAEVYENYFERVFVAIRLVSNIYWNGTQYFENQLIYNNVIVNDTQSHTTSATYYPANCSDPVYAPRKSAIEITGYPAVTGARIYNNTIYIQDSDYCAGIGIKGSGAQPTIQNNVVHITQTGSIYPLRVDTTDNPTVDHNIWWNPNDTERIRWNNGGTIFNLADEGTWQGSHTGGYFTTHDMSMSEGSWTPGSGVPPVVWATVGTEKVVGAGSTIGAVSGGLVSTSDWPSSIVSNPRTGAYDIGAYQYTGDTPPVDPPPQCATAGTWGEGVNEAFESASGECVGVEPAETCSFCTTGLSLGAASCGSGGDIIQCADATWARSGNSSVSMILDHDTADTMKFYADWGSAVGSLYGRYYVKAGASTSDQTIPYFPAFAADSALVDACVYVKWIENNTDGGWKVYIWSSVGTSTNYFALDDGVDYRIEIHAQDNATCTLKVYDTAGNPVYNNAGSPNATATITGRNSAGIRYVIFYDYYNNQSTPTTFYVDDLEASAIDWVGEMVPPTVAVDGIGVITDPLGTPSFALDTTATWTDATVRYLAFRLTGEIAQEGHPELTRATLTLDSNTRYAEFFKKITISSVNYLVYAYTPTIGDRTADLNLASVTGLDCNGATMLDGSGNDLCDDTTAPNTDFAGTGAIAVSFPYTSSYPLYLGSGATYATFTAWDTATASVPDDYMMFVSDITDNINTDAAGTAGHPITVDGNGKVLTGTLTVDQPYWTFKNMQFGDASTSTTTPTELSIWRDRSLNGPYKTTGDVSTNSPGDWDYIYAQANTFVGDPSAERWTGQVAAEKWAPDGGHAVPDPDQGETLRSAAFVYLVLGNESYLDAARDELLSQAAEVGTDFSDGTRWSNDPAIFDAYSHGITSWLGRLIIGYGYIRDSLSGANQATLDTWFENAGIFFEDVVSTRMEQRFPNRDADDYTTLGAEFTLSDGGGCVGLGLGNCITHYGGWDFEWWHEGWNNRNGSQIRFVALAGILANNATLKNNAKRYFKEWLKYAVFSDNTAGGHHRWTSDNPCLGWLYSSVMIGEMVTIADAFARDGDTSLYDYVTSEGIGTLTPAGGLKSLKGTILANMKMMGHITIRYGTDDIAHVGDSDYLIDSNAESTPWSSVADTYFVPANLYYKDEIIKSLYMRARSGTLAYPALVAGSGYYDWGGSWSIYPGVLFMYGDMEDKVDPY